MYIYRYHSTIYHWYRIPLASILSVLQPTGVQYPGEEEVDDDAHVERHRKGQHIEGALKRVLTAQDQPAAGQVGRGGRGVWIDHLAQDQSAAGQVRRGGGVCG